MVPSAIYRDTVLSGWRSWYIDPMGFFRFPAMLFLFVVLFTGGKILPFLFIGFGLMIVARIATAPRSYETRSSISAEQLDELRSDVAIGLLELDNDDRIAANPDLRTRLRTAGTYYAKASSVMDRGVSRRDRDEVARALYRARFELDAAEAERDGRPAPEPPETLRSPGTVVVAAPRRQMRRYRVGCRW
jgi:hypothetical protein